MDKQVKEKIKKLKKEKNYNEIFNQYGREVFLKNVSFRYKRKDLKKLEKESRLEDIYLRYGPKEYNKYLFNEEFEERKEAKGSFKAHLWKLNYRLKILLTSTALALPLPAVVLGTEVDIETYKNSKIYAEEITEYENKITKYAQEVKKLGLNDIQTFMKVYQDMWLSIGGFGEPEKDLTGYLELDLLEEDGEGTCRNMSADIAEKLNKINPNYNARTIVCYTNEPTNYIYANIYIPPKKEKEENVENENNDNEEDTFVSNNVKKVFGNHAVTLVDIEEDGITLALDSTNPGIGLYVNGNIVMFNSLDGNEIIFTTKEYTTIGFLRGIDSTFEIVKDYIDSYIDNPKITYSQIKEKYGLEAQNRAIDEVIEIENKQCNKDSIRDKYKVIIDSDKDGRSYKIDINNKENSKENEYEK